MGDALEAHPIMSYLRLRTELLARFRNGEREALAAVYGAYLPRVRGLLRHGFILKRSALRIPGLTTPDDLADAAQEVFARAFKREARLSYDGLRDYAPYLAVIARNVVITEHRRSGRQLVLVDPIVLLDCERVEADPAQPLQTEPWLDARSLEIARDYISRLDEPVRAVHTARYMQAASQRDAARELGWSRPKVRKLEDKLRRGLAALLTQAGVPCDAPARREAPSLARAGRDPRGHATR
jgi:RNA polymerase sigma-70 factor, ECF subfamily